MSGITPDTPKHYYKEKGEMTLMMMPSIFGGNLFNDDWMDFSFPDIDKELYGKHAKNLMKTDVKEKDGNYEVAIDLPGFKKDEITAELKDGIFNDQCSKRT